MHKVLICLVVLLVVPSGFGAEMEPVSASKREITGNEQRLVRVVGDYLLVREDFSRETLSGQADCEYESDERNLPGRQFHLYKLGKDQENALVKSWLVRDSQKTQESCYGEVEIKSQIAQFRSELKQDQVSLDKIKDEDLLSSATDFEELLGEFREISFEYNTTTPLGCAQKQTPKSCRGQKSLINGKDYLKLDYIVRGRTKESSCKKPCTLMSTSQFTLETKTKRASKVSRYESKIPYNVEPLRLIILNKSQRMIGYHQYQHDWVNNSKSHIEFFEFKLEKKKSKGS